MRRRLVFLGLTLWLWSFPALADEALDKEFGKANTSATQEVGQWMFMRGEWDVTIRMVQDDGTTESEEPASGGRFSLWGS